MKNNNEWESKAEQALNSLNGMQRASANPFLYTRIMARIEEKKNSWIKAMNFLSRPVIAVGITALFITLNALVAFKHPADEKTAAQQNQQNAEQSVEVEYATVNYSLMELNSSDK